MPVQPITLEEVSDVEQPDDAEGLVPREMNLVRNVPVALSVCAGRTSMSIEDLFALKSGDVLSLDTDIDEPLMIYLEDRLVARGTLVAVEDRFGIQVTEII